MILVYFVFSPFLMLLCPSFEPNMLINSRGELRRLALTYVLEAECFGSVVKKKGMEPLASFDAYKQTQYPYTSHFKSPSLSVHISDLRLVILKLQGLEGVRTKWHHSNCSTLIPALANCLSVLHFIAPLLPHWTSKLLIH